jgi:hypothetical protein
MSAINIPGASACVSALLLAAALSAQTTPTSEVETPQTSEVSQVRIVRLSEVKGAVQLDRNTGRGYEPALANLPIVEQSRLQTGTGVAEVEFEDNSTLRIAPGSIVEFPQLGRLAGGATTSSVRLVKGTAYLSLLKTRGNQFNLLFGEQKLQLPPASHIRLQTDGTAATLAVLDGTVHIDGLAGTSDVTKNKTVTFQLQDQSQPTLAKEVAPAAFDAWDKNSADSHTQGASLSSLGAPYSYGIDDMMYYGAFTSVGNCGPMWRPYFTSADWDPYSNGAWAWYQGAGYSWVSPYPWGWTPYHFGSWSYCSGAGWGWRPGGRWNGLNNIAAVGPGVGGAVSLPNNGSGRLPPRPVRPPGPNEPTVTVLNLKPLVRSETVAGNSFVFRKDSAGLGIPREGLGDLDKLSRSAISRGTATMPVYLTIPSAATRNGRPTGEGIMATSIQRGSPSERQAQAFQQSGALRNESGNSTRSAPEQNSQSMRSGPEQESQSMRSSPEQSSQSMRSGPSSGGGQSSPAAAPSGSSPSQGHR